MGLHKVRGCNIDLMSWFKNRELISRCMYAVFGFFFILGVYYIFKHRLLDAVGFFINAGLVTSFNFIFIKRQYQGIFAKGLFIVGCLFLIIAFTRTIQNYSNNKQVCHVSSSDRTQEYHYFAHWSFLNLDTYKLSSDFSTMDLVKNFKNSMATDGAYRPRWIGWFVASITPKINTWVFYQFGIYNLNIVGFICAFLVALTILFFVWKVTSNAILSCGAFVLYATSLDFMTQSVFFFRVGKPLIVIPFLLSILVLDILRSPAVQRRMSNGRFILTFILMAIMMGLDEYGWVMSLTLVLAYWIKNKNIEKKYGDVLKSNLIRLSLCVVVNFGIIAVVHFAFKPPLATRSIIQYVRALVFGWLNLIYQIPNSGIRHFSEAFYGNMGFFRWQFLPIQLSMVLVFVVSGYLIFLCRKAKDTNRELRQFFLIHGITSVGIVLMALMSLRHGADWGISSAYYYYCSYFVIGLPIYLALMAYTLRNEKVLYHVSVFVIGTIALVNSIGFTVMGDITEKLGFGSPFSLVYDLGKIQRAIDSGKTPVLNDTFKNLRRVEDWKNFPNWHEANSSIADAKYTFPLYYYYLIPYIKEGKVLVRPEYNYIFERLQ